MYVLPKRALLAIVTLTAAISTNIHLYAANRIWNTDQSAAIWSNGANWLGGVPAGIGDTAFIGLAAGVENSHVRIEAPVFASGLQLTEGMSLLNISPAGDVFPITVLGDSVAQVGSLDHRPAVRLFRSPAAYDFATNNLHLEFGGNLDLRSGAIAVVGGVLTNTSSGFVEGQGIVNFTATGTTLINDGLLNPKGAIGLTFNQLGDGLYDLDGLNGSGRLRVDGSGVFSGEGYDQMTINGTGLADSFSGKIDLATGRRLSMNLSDGWTADSSSEITIFASATDNGPALIQGNDFTLAGNLDLREGSGMWLAQAQVDAPTTIGPTASVQLGSEALLRFAGQTEIEGGEFVLGQDAEALEFSGPTTVRGGTFSTFSNLSSEGSVNFAGATSYDGTVAISGIARQTGEATVSGNSTINADVFDMDGGGGTMWNVNSDLEINVSGLDSTINNSFDGTINVGGGFLPNLTINLADPADHWTMAGEMNLSNLGFVPFSVGRVAGSPMRLTGELKIENLVGISAPTTFDNNSETNLIAANDRLTLGGRSSVRAGASFNGIGTLVNASDEGMSLEDGVSLDEVGLVNSGRLEIGDSPGLAAVDRFENTDQGTWLVEIGGNLAGTEYDQLIVSGGEATLAGLLEVDLIDVGAGLFLPEIGDQFTVLTAFGDVLGTFDNEPVSFAGGKQFGWSVLYNPHAVILELTSISVPEPNTVALALLGLIGIATRRLEKQLSNLCFKY